MRLCCTVKNKCTLRYFMHLLPRVPLNVLFMFGTATREWKFILLLMLPKICSYNHSCPRCSDLTSWNLTHILLLSRLISTPPLITLSPSLWFTTLCVQSANGVCVNTHYLRFAHTHTCLSSVSFFSIHLTEAVSWVIKAKRIYSLCASLFFLFPLAVHPQRQDILPRWDLHGHGV